MEDQKRERPKNTKSDIYEGLLSEIVSVEELFSGRFLFYLPWFQRAYAWPEEFADRLLHDIIKAERNGEKRYRIGRMLLAGDMAHPRKALIDGQQRAITLTILFSLLRDIGVSPTTTARLDNLVKAPNADADGAYRIIPQPSVAAFFRTHVQDRTQGEALDLTQTSKAERNIANNCDHLKETLKELDLNTEQLERLVDFMLRRCLVSLEIVCDDEEAWKMLETEESTGLAFHPCARAKVTLISKMDRNDQDEAGRIWERWQAALSDDGIMQLLQHLRVLSQTRRSKQPVEKDIATRFALRKNGLAFMVDTFSPAAERMLMIRRANFASGDDQAQIANAIRRMNWLGHTRWMPPAMRWLEIRGGDDVATATFFRLLERKCWMLRVSGADVVEHERRFQALANEIGQNNKPEQMAEFTVSDRVRNNVKKNLSSRTFYDKKYCRSVLRYLCELLGSAPQSLEEHDITVEHVLPRNPKNSTGWRRDFTSQAEISEHVHRIGNLAFLSFQDNQAVANKAWHVKQEYLRKSKFALSQHAALSQHWSPAEIRERGDLLVKQLMEVWGLN